MKPDLSGLWDILVIGGGITGAGILNEASRRGLRALLLERGDFASGTSSRSSKLVHGGLRYIKEGKIALTRESVRERESLLRDAPGLVEPLAFLMPHYPGRKPGRALLGVGLAVYDVLAGSWNHRFVQPHEALMMAPPLRAEGLQGAHLYGDATTDDARLVLRLLQEAQTRGAVALNYVEVRALLRRNGAVNGATVVEVAGGRTIPISARVVINATGAGADALRGTIDEAPKLRPLRGSHLLLPNWRLPLGLSVAFSHPHDGRPVFAYPWCGMTLVGTTDLDHHGDLHSEPRITTQEVSYLLAALADHFPSAQIAAHDIVSTYAGVRPVVASGKTDPSKEGRDQLLLDEQGLITITGGKLTTFRPMALAALRAASKHLGGTGAPASAAPYLVQSPLPHAPALSEALRERLAGRFGSKAQAVVDEAGPEELEVIGPSQTLWAELRYAAQHEAVMRLDDLLLRRTRIGLTFSDGGAALFPRIHQVCRALGWDDARWQREEDAYRSLWQDHYGVPHA